MKFLLKNLEKMSEDKIPTLDEINHLLLILYKRDLIEPFRMISSSYSDSGKESINPNRSILLRKNVMNNHHEQLWGKHKLQEMMEENNHLVDSFIQMCERRYGIEGTERVWIRFYKKHFMFHKHYDTKIKAFEKETEEKFKKDMMERFRKTFPSELLKEYNISDMVIVPYFGAESDPSFFNLEEAFAQNLADASFRLQNYPLDYVEKSYEIYILEGIGKFCPEICNKEEWKREQEKEKEMIQELQKVIAQMPMVKGLPLARLPLEDTNFEEPNYNECDEKLKKEEEEEKQEKEKELENWNLHQTQMEETKEMDEKVELMFQLISILIEPEHMSDMKNYNMRTGHMKKFRALLKAPPHTFFQNIDKQYTPEEQDTALKMAQQFLAKQK